MASTFIVVYKNGETKELDAQNKADLILEYFDNNEQEFKNKVKLIRWQQDTVHYSENIENGETHESVQSADTNPYGWRNEASQEGKPIKPIKPKKDTENGEFLEVRTDKL